MNNPRGVRIVRNCLSHALQEMELAILACPSGEFRKALTEINMHLMAASNAIDKTQGDTVPVEHPFPPEGAAWTFTDDEEIDALNLMSSTGGGFARGLAVAWQRADAGNRDKLRTAFVNFILPYVLQCRINKERA